MTVGNFFKTLLAVNEVDSYDSAEVLCISLKIFYNFLLIYYFKGFLEYFDIVPVTL